jgi:probable HAF family extracellular repeat protein
MTFARMTTFTLLIAFAFTVRSLAQDEQKSPSNYAVNNLGTLGGTSASANGINNEGMVAGTAALPGDQAEHAVVWLLGIKIDLGTLGGPNSFANLAPNDLGQVAGGSDTTVPDPLGSDFCGFGTQLICRPFIWSFGRKTTLPLLGGNNAYAQAINNPGQVVGQAENSPQDPSCLPEGPLEREAVIWSAGKHVIRELSPLPGDPDGLALAINDRGQVAGASGNCANINTHAVIWNNGNVVDLGSLGGNSLNAGMDINSLGDVAGVSGLPDSTFHAFLWHDNVMSDLGTVPGDTFSIGIGVNDKRQVVGLSCDADFNCGAFLWQDGVMTDLNTLIAADSPLFLISGGFINAGGEIVGQAFDESTGNTPAFLAIPQSGRGDKLAAQPRTGSTRRIQLPESMRKLLRQRPAGFKLRLSGLETRSAN